MESLLKINTIKSDYYDNNCSEILNISSLSLIKMLRHGKAGIPIEVMGLMLGKFKNQSNIQVQDVFAMPQTGTGFSVESIDPVFQTKMLEMYEQNGNSNIIIGWYHSHPGFGCWLSGVDINTQQNFEYLNKRSVAVVIDPIQSIKGRVLIEAFRSTSPFSRFHEKRDVTSIYSMINNPSLFRRDHGLNKYYYSIRIGFKKSLLEEITITSIYQKDCETFLKVQLWKSQLQIKIVEILRKLIYSLIEIFSEESFFFKNFSGVFLNDFKKEIKKINEIIKTIFDKISSLCLYNILIEYIS